MVLGIFINQFMVSKSQGLINDSGRFLRNTINKSLTMETTYFSRDDMSTISWGIIYPNFNEIRDYKKKSRKIKKICRL